MRFLLIMLMSALLTAPAALAGDPLPGMNVSLEINAVRPGDETGHRPTAGLEAVTDRGGEAVFGIEGTGWATLFIHPDFEGRGEMTLFLDRREVLVPFSRSARERGRIRVVSFQALRGERVRVRLERPDGER